MGNQSLAIVGDGRQRVSSNEITLMFVVLFGVMPNGEPRREP